MQLQFLKRLARIGFLAFALMGMGAAMAQSVATSGEPTLTEVYAAAQAGKLDQAQVMMQQVLISHPNSAKAYFVQAELFARQGNIARARDALTSAEKIAPNLPFAKPQAVKELRSQLNAHGSVGVPMQSGGPALASPSSLGGSWVVPLALTIGVIAAGYFIFRKKAPVSNPAAYAGAGNLSGAQTFGTPGAVAMQPAYAPAPTGGLGGQILGGVATGLAVGAGVMAAEAIGRNLMGSHAPSSSVTNAPVAEYAPSNVNTDMGGQDFGVNDSGSWDDASTADIGGGGWDS